MRRRFLFLTCLVGAASVCGQNAVDVARPEQRERERKTAERAEERSAQSANVEIRGATAFTQPELISALKEQMATIHDFGLTPARADDAAFFLQLFYRKHGYARVEVRYELRGGSRLLLVVDEGPLARLTNIEFIGNTHVPAEKLYEYAVGPTRERYSRLQTQLPFVAADVDDGVDLIRRFYISEGFLDALVEEPSVRYSGDGASVQVVIRLHEGRQYRFGDVQFRGNTIYGPAALRGQMQDLLAQPYTDRRIDDIPRRLQAYFKARGYYDVKVVATGNPTKSDSSHVPVTVTISPGPLYHFDGITIAGVKRLRPSYLRHRFSSLSGKTYSPDVLDEKFRELMRTGLFNVLQINPHPVGDNLLRLDISVDEAKAKEFGLSVGYGSYQGPIAGVQYADRDLFGYGRPLTTSIEVSGRGYKGEVVWDDPHFFETDFELKARLSALTFDFDGYSKFEIGGRLALSHKFSKHYEIAAFVSPRRVDLTDAAIQRSLLGNTRYFVDSIGLSQVIDFRDSPVLPTRGFVADQSVEVASSAVGSEIDFVRATARLSYFIPLGRTLLELGGRGGVVQPLNDSNQITALPIDERFFNGGSSTVRSFGERDLGPHDKRGYPIGGQFYTIFNAEYTFPLYGELQGAVFVDAGNLLPNADQPGLNDMRYGIGAGLRYKLPIGPIRLDYGVNPDPRPGEDFGAFHFSFGFAF